LPLYIVTVHKLKEVVVMRVHQVPLAALLAAAFTVPSISQGASEPQYRFKATALLPFTSGVTGQGSGVAQVINNPGMTCGARLGGIPFCYDEGHLFDLRPLPGDTVTAVNGINDRGQVVGFSQADPEHSHAVIWYKGEVSQLPLDGSSATATDINNGGNIVGQHNGIGFLLKDGVVQDLGGQGTYPTAINNKDQIVGLSLVPDPLGLSTTVDHAFLYEGGAMRDLGTLGGRSSRANGINSHGQVVGTSDVLLAEGSPYHAFVYYNNVMHDLGAWPNGASTQGRGINNLGQVVGAVAESDPTLPPAFNGRAFLWERDTGYQDLNALIDPAEGWKIIYATSINDRQEIVGFGCKEDLCGPVLLKLCGDGGRKSHTERAPQGEKPRDRRNNNSERQDPNGGGGNGGSVLAIPL
jgi:probable HAF family extracellular repeat protein